MSNEERTGFRRFTYVRGPSDKFWEVWTQGATMHARWGRNGTSGQSKTWDYGSLAAARSMASRKANQKIAKGYVEEIEISMIRDRGEVRVVYSQTEPKAKPKKKKAKPKPEPKAKAKPKAANFRFVRRNPKVV